MTNTGRTKGEASFGRSSDFDRGSSGRTEFLMLRHMAAPAGVTGNPSSHHVWGIPESTNRIENETSPTHIMVHRHHGGVQQRSHFSRVYSCTWSSRAHADYCMEKVKVAWRRSTYCTTRDARVLARFH